MGGMSSYVKTYLPNKTYAGLAKEFYNSLEDRALIGNDLSFSKYHLRQWLIANSGSRYFQENASTDHQYARSWETSPFLTNLQTGVVNWMIKKGFSARRSWRGMYKLPYARRAGRLV